MKTPSSLCRILAAYAAALLTMTLGTGSTLATDGSWLLNGNSNWGLTTSWGRVTVATFDLDFASGANITVTLETAYAVGTLKLGHTSSRSLNINRNTLTLDNGGSEALINFNIG